jgi:hypothetical protein
MNGNPLSSAKQTINSITNYIPQVDIVHWSFGFPTVLPAGTYTFEVKGCRYDAQSPNFTASGNNESSLIIQVFY